MLNIEVQSKVTFLIQEGVTSIEIILFRGMGITTLQYLVSLDLYKRAGILFKDVICRKIGDKERMFTDFQKWTIQEGTRILRSDRATGTKFRAFRSSMGVRVSPQPNLSTLGCNNRENFFPKSCNISMGEIMVMRGTQCRMEE